MFERTMNVIKNKNKVEQARRKRYVNNIQNLRSKSAFSANLYKELRHVDVILSDSDVDAVVVSVPDNAYYQFSEAIYSEDLAGYSITQLDGDPSKFLIRRKVVEF